MPGCAWGPGWCSGQNAGCRLIHCVVSGLGGPGSGGALWAKSGMRSSSTGDRTAVFCLDLLLRLKFTRLRYRKVDIRKDPDARAIVRSVADGNETVPTVVVAGHALVNPSKRQIDRGRANARAARALSTVAMLFCRGWRWPPTWPGSRTPSANTPSLTCAPTCAAAPKAAWARRLCGVRTWSCTSGRCRRSADGQARFRSWLARRREPCRFPS